MPGEIALADNAHDTTVIIDNRQPSPLIAGHLSDAITDRVIEVTGEGSLSHTVSHNSVPQVRPFGDDTRYDITVGHYSKESAALVNHRNRPTIAIAHQAGCVINQISWVN